MKRLAYVPLVYSETPRVLPPPGLLLRPPISGYHMVKGATGWARLIIVEPAKGPVDAG